VIEAFVSVDHHWAAVLTVTRARPRSTNSTAGSAAN